MSEHCETATAAMDQAIPCLAGDSAAGRVEETRAEYHAAASDSTVLWMKRLVCMATA